MDGVLHTPYRVKDLRKRSCISFHQYMLPALRSSSIYHLRPFTTRSCFCYLPVHAIVAEMLHQQDTSRLSYDVLFTLEYSDTDLGSISLYTSKLQRTSHNFYRDQAPLTRLQTLFTTQEVKQSGADILSPFKVYEPLR